MSYRPKIKNDATGTVSDLALDAETLAGHESSYYLNYNNLTNKPTIPVNDIIILEDNGSTTAGTWLAKTSKISAYADGQIFLYKLVVAGAATTTLNITGSGGSALGAKTVYRVGTTKLGTQYPVGHYVLLVYNSLNTCFRVLNDYDANSYAYVRQYQHGSNAAGTTNLYPILTRYNLTNKNGTYDTAYARYYTDTYINTTNGYLYAPKVYSGGNEVLTTANAVTESTVSGWGFTKNTGTVTSVSAGTGLSISGTATTTPTVNVASGYKLPTTTEWNNKLEVTLNQGPGGTTTVNVRITDLGTGRYNLKGTNTWGINYNGTSGTELCSANAGHDMILEVAYLSTVDKWSWKLIPLDPEYLIVYFGQTTSESGWYSYYSLNHVVTSYITGSSATKPVYLQWDKELNTDGYWSKPRLQLCNEYAGGTAVTLNGTSKAASTASFYAPTASGTSGQFLKSAGANASPTWETVTIPTKSSWNYDDMYVKYSASQGLTDAQKTQARSNIGAGTSNFTGYTSSNKLSTDYINNAAGWTSNAGTVTSVRVQAGTGLSSSTSTAQSTSLNTTISIASGYKLLTTNEYDNLLYNLGPYDTISGNTITRQTGYAQIKDLEWSKISNNRFEAVISDAEGSSDASTTDIIFSDVFSASSPNNVYYNSSSNIAAINSSKYLLIFVTSDYYSNKTVNDFLSDYGNVYIQYKLATSYTEKAITNKQLNVNSELEKDVAKNMYNLGKYDSQPVINSDNTVTITRNTGFIVADWHWTKDSDGYNNLKRYYHYFDSLLDAEYDSNGVGVFYSNYGVSDYSTKAGAYFGKANNKTFVGFLTTDDLSDSQLNALGITIQYKLATSYTEKAIYNSPVKPSSISGYKLITTAEYDSLVNQANAGLEYQDIYNSYTEVNSGTYKTLITWSLDENCVYLVVGHSETNFHDASEPCGVWLRAYDSDHTLVDERVNRTMNHSGGGVDATMIINTKTGSARWVSCLVYNYYPGVREFSARMTVVKLVTNK